MLLIVQPVFATHLRRIESSASKIDAIVTISMGDSTNTNMVDGLLSSLSGRVDYPVFIITDSPSCIDVSLYDGQVHLVSPVSVNTDVMYIKSFKTRIFEFLPQRMNRILYLDRDIRGTPALSSWIPNDGNINGSCNISMQRERVGVNNPFNSGTIIMDRNIASECLDPWKDQILSGKFSKDQPALESTPECRICAIKDDPVSFSRSIWSMLGLPLENKPFVHYTSTTHREKETQLRKCQERVHYYDASCWFNGMNLDVEKKECNHKNPFTKVRI